MNILAPDVLMCYINTLMVVSWLDLITPINLLAEGDRFFVSSNYNPVFKYNWSTSRLSGFNSSNSNFGELIKTILTGETSQIIENSKEIFSVDVEEKTLAIAKQIVNASTPLVNSQTLDQFVSAMAIAIKKLDLGYNIKVQDRAGFNVRPSHSAKTVAISKYINLHFFDIDGLVKHEISHVIRNVNHEQNQLTILPTAVATGEGLAAYMQDYYGNNGEGSLYQHAAEYAATEIGLKGSLRDIYDFFMELGFSKELAWQRSVRHKFGFTDTKKPGDIMKPAMYFYHEQKIKALTDDERWRLFMGKIRIEELKDYPEYKGIVPLLKLKEFYQH